MTTEKDKALFEASEAMVRLRTLLSVEPSVHAMREIDKLKLSVIRLKVWLAIAVLVLGVTSVFVASIHGFPYIIRRVGINTQMADMQKEIDNLKRKEKCYVLPQGGRYQTHGNGIRRTGSVPD